MLRAAQVHEKVGQRAARIERNERQVRRTGGEFAVAIHIDRGHTQQFVVALRGHDASHHGTVHFLVANRVIENRAQHTGIGHFAHLAVGRVDEAQRAVAVEHIGLGRDGATEGLQHFGFAESREHQLAIGAQVFLRLLSESRDRRHKSEKERE